MAIRWVYFTTAVFVYFAGRCCNANETHTHTHTHTHGGCDATDGRKRYCEKLGAVAPRPVHARWIIRDRLCPNPTQIHRSREWFRNFYDRSCRITHLGSDPFFFFFLEEIEFSNNAWKRGREREEISSFVEKARGCTRGKKRGRERERKTERGREGDWLQQRFAFLRMRFHRAVISAPCTIKSVVSAPPRSSSVLEHCHAGGIRARARAGLDPRLPTTRMQSRA